eukprot:GHUV01054595.1.p1 GENE.GHUV01054595.1~~GHUV01054595.1.p1  ORF type:complete len:100 (-),score=17.84 GHUV01054595.1:185-484(-)
MRVPSRHLARLARAYAQRNSGAGVQQAANLGRIAVEAPGSLAASLQLVRGQAQAAVQVNLEQQVHVIPEIKTDIFGAVSPVSEADLIEEGVFRNVDGHR